MDERRYWLETTMDCWTFDHGSSCIRARRSLGKSQRTKSSLSVLPIDPETDITTRFKSPIPPNFGLKCIGFTYSINIGHSKTLTTAQNSAYLALLQQQKRHILFVCSLVLFCIISGLLVQYPCDYLRASFALAALLSLIFPNFSVHSCDASLIWSLYLSLSIILSSLNKRFSNIFRSC